MKEPAWIRQAVWWQLYPLGFVGAEADARSCPQLCHRLGQVEAWLDYAVDLGVSGLALGPLFAAETHGYDTIDHFRLDPRLGDDADFDHLVAALGQRGLKLLLDGVFNHVGRGFPQFQRALAGGPQAPEGQWFRLNWTARASAPDYADFEGHRHLVALNHDHPEVVDYVARVMIHWLDRGAHGWRLDAAYAVPPAFWAQVLERVRPRYPDAYVFGEVIHGDYAGIVERSGLDAVTQYELWKAIWSALNDGNFFELSWALGRHDGFLDHFVPQTFVGNHDVTRLATRLTEPRHLPHALVVLLTVAGTPSVYAGDEQGFQGLKEDRAGGDDAIRPAFPPTPQDLAPWGWPLYRLHQRLIGLRRRHPWLHRARCRMLSVHNRHLVYESSAEGQRLVVALSLDDSACRLPVPDCRRLVEGQGRVRVSGQDGAMVEIPPHGWAILAG